MVIKKFDINQQLSGVDSLQSESILQLRQEIALLEETKLEQQNLIEKLQENLHTSSIQDLPLEKIYPNLEQPRQTFLPESIKAIASSLSQQGQLQPIIVVAMEEKYIIVDGERRWRAANSLEWKTIKAIQVFITEELSRTSLLTFIHREDLNPLDKAAAIVKELSRQSGIDRENIPRIISTAVRRLQRNNHLNTVVALIPAATSEQELGLASINLNEDENKLLLSLLDLQLNPVSATKNLFPMLNLALDLQQAIRTQGLNGLSAMVLNQLNAKNLRVEDEKATQARQKATEKVILEKLSVANTRKLVAEILGEVEGKNIGSQVEKQLRKVTSSLDTLIKEASSDELEAIAHLLQEKLAIIEKNLDK